MRVILRCGGQNELLTKVLREAVGYSEVSLLTNKITFTSGLNCCI